MNQFKEIPVLHLEVKMKVGDREVTEFSPFDYPIIYFKVNKLNNSNFCPLARYPLPKTLRFFVFTVVN